MIGAKPAPALKYPGAKHRLADWIVSHMPPHTMYAEPFAGSLAVLLAKRRSQVEIVNDLNGRVANFWRVLRDSPDELQRAVALTPYSRQEFRQSFAPALDPVEDARKLAVNCWQGWPGKSESGAGWRRQTKNNHRGTTYAHDWHNLPERLRPAAARLAGVYVEHRDALSLVAELGSEVLIYADPPYLLSTLGSPNYMYESVMDASAHERLLAALRAHSGPVLLSGYDSELYDGLLVDWSAAYKSTRAENGYRREILWSNPTAQEMLEGRLF